MRERLASLGVPCPRNAVVSDVAGVEEFGFPAVLKTTRGGYDGKGVWVVRSAEDCAEAFETAARTGVRILAEELVDFRRGLSAPGACPPSRQPPASPPLAPRQNAAVRRAASAP